MIVVGVSGGIDSAALLWESLRATRCDVVALHIPDTGHLPEPAAGYISREEIAFRRVVKWCHDNIRPLTPMVGEVVRCSPNGTPYDASRRIRLRPERARTVGTYWAECRSASIGFNARAAGASEVWLGHTRWNTRGSAEAHRIQIAALADWFHGPIVAPFLTPETKSWETAGFAPSSGLATMAGPNRRERSKIDVFREMPAPLRSLTVGCSLSDPPRPQCQCNRCISARFYDLICAPHPRHVEAIETRLERKAHVGRFADVKVPPSFSLDTFANVLDDIGGWRRWLSEVENA